MKGKTKNTTKKNFHAQKYLLAYKNQFWPYKIILFNPFKLNIKFFLYFLAFYLKINHIFIAFNLAKYINLFVLQSKPLVKSDQKSFNRLQAIYQALPTPTFTWEVVGKDFELIDYNKAAIQFFIFE